MIVIEDRNDGIIENSMVKDKIDVGYDSSITLNTLSYSPPISSRYVSNTSNVMSNYPISNIQAYIDDEDDYVADLSIHSNQNITEAFDFMAGDDDMEIMIDNDSEPMYKIESEYLVENMAEEKNQYIEKEEIAISPPKKENFLSNIFSNVFSSFGSKDISTPTSSNVKMSSSSNISAKAPNTSYSSNISVNVPNTSYSSNANAPITSYSSNINVNVPIVNTPITRQSNRSSSNSQGYEDIIKLQKANGSWNWSEIVNLIPSLSTIESSNPVGDSTIWATAIIIYYLESHFSGSKNMWSLSTKKATSFLKKECSKNGFDYDTVVNKATECSKNL